MDCWKVSQVSVKVRPGSYGLGTIVKNRLLEGEWLMRLVVVGEGVAP